MKYDLQIRKKKFEFFRKAKLKKITLRVDTSWFGFELN